MRHPPIVVLGYSEAGMLLRAEEGREVGAIISICGKRDYAVEAAGVEHTLVLHFDDVEVDDGTDPFSRYMAWARRRQAAQVGLEPVPPVRDDARAIIEFAESIKHIEGIVLCQCQAGMSRSPAAALLCLAAWTEAGEEAYCVTTVREARPAAVPHRDLVRFGDEILGRAGKLVAALNAT
jgi:predicted protein tyrosine phosphatase